MEINVEEIRESSVIKGMYWIRLACEIFIVIHLPSLVLFLIEPNYQSTGGFVRFFQFSWSQYCWYFRNQVDLLAMLLVALSATFLVDAKHRTSANSTVLVVYFFIAAIVYAIRCFGRLGGLSPI
jgi:uncharacterized membrane protein